MDPELAKWIIGGMGIAISAMAIYIVKLWRDRDEERKARIKYLEDQNQLLNLMSSVGRDPGDQGNANADGGNA